jgi:hypothetical protein
MTEKNERKTSSDYNYYYVYYNYYNIILKEKLNENKKIYKKCFVKCKKHKK